MIYLDEFPELEAIKKWPVTMTAWRIATGAQHEAKSIPNSFGRI